MQPKLSQLKLVDFVIINYNFSFEPPTSNDINTELLFASYDIDVDFAVDELEKNIRVFVKIEINNSEKPIFGYSILGECIAVFNLDLPFPASDERFTTEKFNYINNSAIPLTINSLRTYILTATASAPMGKYILPSIDIRDLYLQKESKISETIDEAKPKKRPTKPKITSK